MEKYMYILTQKNVFSGQEDNHLHLSSISTRTLVQSSRDKEKTLIRRQVSEENSVLIAYPRSVPSCTEGILVNVEVVSDAFPSFHPDGWDITHIPTKKLVWSSSFYDKQLTLYNESTCLDIGEYRFSFHDVSLDGIIDEGAYYILRVNDEIIKETHGPSKFKIQTTYFGYCSSNIDCFDDDVCTEEYCDLSTKTCVYEFQKHYSKECSAFGNQSALAIRVISLDAETTSSEIEIRKSIFGVSEGEFSMSSQLSSCSYNKLNIEPFMGMTNNGTPISNGVFNLFLPMNVTGEAANVIGSLALSSAYESIPNLSNNVLMFVCLPPKTRIGISENWKAYAFVNAFHSIYNDINCLYPSVLMHEVGHNLGLSHSNDEKNYGDESGAMGISYTKTDGPVKCFNAPKSWQLGWYADSHIIIDANKVDRSTRLELVGISDYNVRGKKDTIVKIINSNDSYDYYISFNRKSHMNIETNEGGDKLMIFKRPIGLAYSDSTLLNVVLTSGFTYAIVGFDGSYQLEIGARYSVRGELTIAEVGIFKWTSYCLSNADCNDLDTCSIDSCYSLGSAFGVCVNTPVEDCSICGNKVYVKVTTNDNPDSITWKVSNVIEEKALMSSGSYAESYKTYSESTCIPFGTYKFSITNSKNSTETNSHIFSLEVGDIIIDRGELSGVNILETNFIICSLNTDCHDYDGCTVDYCNMETTLCENSDIGNITTCNDCSWLSINITMDNFPEETAWDLVIEDLHNTLLSGDPYALYLHRNGRRKAPTKAGRSKAPTRASLLYSVLDEEADEIQMYERFCAENSVKFSFTITDSFGDGICCTEGLGGYEVMGNNDVIKSGGDFGDRDNIIFKFAQCFFDSDCDDNDSCTVESCSPSNSICFYRYLPCDECGAMATIKFYADYYPTQTEWTLRRGEQELMSIGPYQAMNGEYHHSICLSYGSYALKINDHSGISWCCDYTRSTAAKLEECIKAQTCGYKVLVNNQTILEGGDNVPSIHKDINFGLCEKDSDCEDFDNCTKNLCDLSLRICKFDPLPCVECSEDPCDRSSSCINPLPCSECGKTLFSVDIHTDVFSVYLSWFLRNAVTKNLLASAQWRGKIFHHYKDEMCLEDGSYEFLVSDLGVGYGSGIVYCKDEEVLCGNWSISVDGSVLKQGNRNFTGLDVTVFEASRITSIPTSVSSISASKSSKPNTFPPSLKSSSKFPSQVTKAPRTKEKKKKSKKRNKKRSNKKKIKKNKELKKQTKKKKKASNKTGEKLKKNKKSSGNKQSRKKEKIEIIPFDNLS